MVAVTVDGCHPLCIKRIKGKGLCKKMLTEIEYMKDLEGVPGLSRVLGYSVKPMAFLMTRHGTTTFQAILEKCA